MRRNLLVFILSLCAGLCRAAGKPPGILLVGDSHVVGQFGTTLDELLRAARPQATVETYGSCGSSPSWFLPGGRNSGHATTCGYYAHRYLDGKLVEERELSHPAPLLGELLESKPAVVILALGSNLIDWEKAGDPAHRIGNADSAGTMAHAVIDSGALCLWIGPADKTGPPKLKIDRAVSRQIVLQLNEELKRQTRGLCRYIDSRVVYEGPDGKHYSSEAGKRWAGEIFAELEGSLPR